MKTFYNKETPFSLIFFYHISFENKITERIYQALPANFSQFTNY